MDTSIPLALLLCLCTSSHQQTFPGIVTIGSVANLNQGMSAANSDDRQAVRHELRKLVGMNKKDLLKELEKLRERMDREAVLTIEMLLTLYRDDIESIIPPAHVTMPDKFFSHPVLKAGLEKAGQEDILRISWDEPPYQTFASSVPEHKLWYFREDPLVNAHHWHWHLLYTFGLPEAPLVSLVKRGESFYYMHNQMMARYNTEREALGLEPTFSFNSSMWRKPIALGYYSKLTDRVTNARQPGRPNGMVLQPTRRYGRDMSVEIMEKSEKAILEAIDNGYLLRDDGEKVWLNYSNQQDFGINELANVVEISFEEISINRELYGSLHDDAHLMIGVIHDPDSDHLEPPTAMGYHSSALRDPLFYPLHHYLNVEIFQKYKASIPPYGHKELGFGGVEILDLATELERSGEMNVLNTFEDWTEINLDTGLVFGNDDGAPTNTNRSGPGVRFGYKQLNHQPFHYKISIRNTGKNMAEGWLRIFVAPETNQDQRMLMIELDRFPVTISPGETTNLLRPSSLTPVTAKLPKGVNFSDLQSLVESGEMTQEQFNRLGCGWPEHLLVPRGREGGMVFHLLVMVSRLVEGENLPEIDNEAFTMCGSRHGQVDKRPMGFPVDRPADCTGMAHQQNWRCLLRDDRKNIVTRQIKIVFHPK